MSVRIAGRSYELLSASTSLSDDAGRDNVDAPSTKRAAGHEDGRGRGRSTSIQETRSFILNQMICWRRPRRRPSTRLVDGAVLAVAVGAIADAAHLEGTSSIVAANVLEAARRSSRTLPRERSPACSDGLSRRQVLMADALRLWCGVVYEEREDCGDSRRVL